MHALGQTPIRESEKTILSVDDVARILDCSRSHVANLLNGKFQESRRFRMSEPAAFVVYDARP